MRWGMLVMLGIWLAAGPAMAEPTSPRDQPPQLLSIIEPARPMSRWQAKDSNWEWAIGGGVEASNFANPSVAVFDLSFTSRARMSCGCIAALVGNERGAMLRVAYRDGGHLLSHDRGEVVISLGATLNIAPIGSRLRGPSALGLLLPRIGAVFDSRGTIRDAQLSLLNIPLTKIVRRGMAIRLEPTLTVMVPLRSNVDSAAYYGLTLSLVML